MTLTYKKTERSNEVQKKLYKRSIEEVEGALVMAGENGREHQVKLLRCLRKHPSYWNKPPIDFLSPPTTSSSFKQKKPPIHLVDVDDTIVGDDTALNS